MLRKRYPKDILCWKNNSTHGVASAYIGFNDGASGILDVMIKHGMEVGDFCRLL